MTLVAVWVQKNETLRQLNVVSDSRLSGGESWDACPKVVPLPRPATVIAMSGSATEAYAFLLQAINACTLLDGHVSGRTDISYLARKLKDVYSDSRNHVKDLPRTQSKADTPTLDVVLAGWSWRRSRFEGYSYSYGTDGSLEMKRLSELDEDRRYGIYFFGDAAPFARGRSRELLRERGLWPVADGIAVPPAYQWEPLEIVLEAVQNPDLRTVGGVPQITSAYQYGETESFVWEDDQQARFYGGRPILEKERSDRRILSMNDGAARVRFSESASVSPAQDVRDAKKPNVLTDPPTPTETAGCNEFKDPREPQ
ncbi:hypothetical protein IFT72_06155 [Frigoribacterium sp. CFBP 8754]|uniref:hypothetical protein n=1 Tax=Frigoribacterium sp. CFBP 8754 TaxID=2775290 RepID=UPI00177FF8B8|nr:hypothetical protein [Frigoribacterium sp. CFBP 8754]MBD8659772.1 hypothetical protein [Frigoribacterium sp. CFBP 8754]